MIEIKNKKQILLLLLSYLARNANGKFRIFFYLSSDFPKVIITFIINTLLLNYRN